MLCTIKFWVHLHTYKFMFSLQIAYLFLRINLVVRFASASLSSMIRRMASCQKFLRYSMGVTNNHRGRIYFGKNFQSECFIFIDICLLLKKYKSLYYWERRMKSYLVRFKSVEFPILSKKKIVTSTKIWPSNISPKIMQVIFKNNNNIIIFNNIGMTRLETL